MSNVLKLGDVAVVKGGSGFPEKYQGGSHGLPFIKVSDMNLPGNQRYIWKSNNYLNTTAYNLLKPTIFPKDTVVFAKVGAAVYLNKRRILTEATAIDNNLMGVTATAIEPLFLYYLLQSIDLAEWVQPGALPSINQTIIEALPIPITDRKRQRYVSEVLNVVDNQIDATQALIDKYTAIKQGMMADLFSRGIDPETKALRPTFEDAPELYHETPLGMLPKGWCVKTLGNAINGSGFIQTGPFGSQLHAYDYVDSGVPVVMPQDIVQGRISIEKIAYITERKASELSRHKLKLNDVIFSRRGDLTRSSFVDVQNGYEGFLCGTGCLLMRVDTSNIVGGWFSYLYSSDLVQRQVEGLAVGTTMPNLNGSILKKLIIPFPSVEEQTYIFSTIASAQSLIDENAKHLGKLVAQKAGLMQDLLTGKVPVPV